MAGASRRQVPGTPRVISPSPDASESSDAGRDGYFHTAPRASKTSTSAIDTSSAKRKDGPDPDVRARSHSRDVDVGLRNRRPSGLTAVEEEANGSFGSYRLSPNGSALHQAGGTANGHLAPESAAQSYWRRLSRSPSPLGLIPVHLSWRSFVHRHEIPRKSLHVSIGFLALGLYAFGYQTSSIHPVLLTLLIPIALVDLVRHNWPSFNRFYIRTLGAFMRETEAHEKYNGVIWYLLGAWAVLRFCPKDVGVMSVCLLSWCDTAASTFGRLWGRYTPRIRRGKSLAGSLAACIIGIGTAVVFWGIVAPKYEALGTADNTGINGFAFQGSLGLPAQAKKLLGLGVEQGVVSGGVALGIMSLWAGFVASASEAVDIFGWDDNITIPMLCGVGLWGFLKVFSPA